MGYLYLRVLRLRMGEVCCKHTRQQHEKEIWSCLFTSSSKCHNWFGFVPKWTVKEIYPYLDMSLISCCTWSESNFDCNVCMPTRKVFPELTISLGYKHAPKRTQVLPAHTQENRKGKSTLCPNSWYIQSLHWPYKNHCSLLPPYSKTLKTWLPVSFLTRHWRVSSTLNTTSGGDSKGVFFLNCRNFDSCWNSAYASFTVLDEVSSKQSIYGGYGSLHRNKTPAPLGSISDVNVGYLSPNWWKSKMPSTPKQILLSGKKTERCQFCLSGSNLPFTLLF